MTSAFARGIVIAAVAMSALPTISSACTRDAAIHDRQTKAYAASVTSVYRAAAEDFRPVDPAYPDDAFSVRLRPTELIWGAPPPRPVELKFEAGACVEWFFASQDETPIDGQTYFVFYAPSAMDDLSDLRVYPDKGGPPSAAMEMLDHLKADGAGPPRPRRFGAPMIGVAAAALLLLLL